MSQNIKINGHTFNNSETILAYVVLALSIMVCVLSVGLIFLWIYYSLIRRTNSKNLTGRDISEHIFHKAGMKPTIKSSFIYIKYWNYNARRNTYRLRPWTHNRKSIWTMMEASQQAYASSIRFNKGKTFWLIFRLPIFIRIFGGLGAALFIYFGMKTFSGGLSNMNIETWFWFSQAFSFLLIAYTIADVGKIYVLWKNVDEAIKDSGLSWSELKAIKRIFFWRMVYAIVVVIIEVIKTVIHIMNIINNSNDNK